jgi:hypothetical protein
MPGRASRAPRDGSDVGRGVSRPGSAESVRSVRARCRKEPTAGPFGDGGGPAGGRATGARAGRAASAGRLSPATGPPTGGAWCRPDYARRRAGTLSHRSGQAGPAARPDDEPVRMPGIPNASDSDGPRWPSLRRSRRE